MLFGVPWLVVLHYVTGGIILWFLARVWQYRDRPGGKLWIVVMLFMAGAAFSYGTGLLVFDRTVRMYFEYAYLLCLVYTGEFYLLFAIVYTGRFAYLDKPFAGMTALLTLIGVPLLLTNEHHNLYFSDFRVVEVFDVATASYTMEPFLYVFATLIYVSVGIAVILLTQAVASHGRAYRRQASAITLTPLFPVAASFLWLFDVGPYPDVNLVALAFLPHLLFDVYALFGHAMFDLPPGLRRAGERAAIDDLGSPVFIVADDGRILDLNTEAATLFDTDKESVLTRQLAKLLGTDVALDGSEQLIDLELGGEHRTFKLVASTFETLSDRHTGYTVILQDVTVERQRKQQLDVLNRVLRHNLRNDLNVAQLHAQQLESEAPDESTENHAAAISAVSEDLVELGEKSRLASEALADLAFRAVDLGPLVEGVVASVTRGEDDVSVDLTVREDPAVDADPEVLQLVLRSVLENAIEHTLVAPTISITVEPETPDTALVTIADDGPGLPDHERAVIENGGESALKHASGIGLWLIRWGVTVLHGDVTFDANEDGTTVEIRLPRWSDPE